MSKHTPVAYLIEYENGEREVRFQPNGWGDKVTPLYTHPAPDDTALLRQALEALESVYPYTDSLICYASTVDEHPPNAIDGNVRDALTALRERLGEKP